MSDANATWQGGGCKVPDSCLLHPRQFLFKRHLATGDSFQLAHPCPFPGGLGFPSVCRVAA